MVSECRVRINNVGGCLRGTARCRQFRARDATRPPLPAPPRPAARRVASRGRAGRATMMRSIVATRLGHFARSRRRVIGEIAAPRADNRAAVRRQERALQNPLAPAASSSPAGR